MSNFSLYQQFFSAEQAEPVISILKEHQIPFEFKQSRKIVDAVIIGETSSDHLYELKIPSSRFEELNILLQQNTQVNIDELDADYYLFSFSDNELKEIIQKPDEWSNQDYVIAKALLERKGIKYSSEELASLKKERLGTLRRPEKIHSKLLWLGYVLILISPGLSMCMGLSIWQVKKTAPNGIRDFVYDFQSRQNGKALSIIALAFFVIIFVSLNNGDLSLFRLVLPLISYYDF